MALLGNAPVDKIRYAWRMRWTIRAVGGKSCRRPTSTLSDDRQGCPLSVQKAVLIGPLSSSLLLSPAQLRKQPSLATFDLVFPTSLRSLSFPSIHKMLKGSDVAAHNSADSLWMIIHGKVSPYSYAHTDPPAAAVPLLLVPTPFER